MVFKLRPCALDENSLGIGRVYVFTIIFPSLPGYTGFVPRSRGLLGKGYPIITHEALNDFTDDLMRIKMAAGKPISIRREEIMRIDTKPIYPKESGLVPHYTGHIPGRIF